MMINNIQSWKYQLESEFREEEGEMKNIDIKKGHVGHM